MHAPSAGPVVAVPNVTPMIDVMLVLLCIFMIVTPAIANGVVAEPPEAVNLKPHPDDGFDHTLAIDVRGALYLDRQPIAMDGLRVALARLFPVGADDRVLYVRAHRELEFGKVRAALDIAGASGVRVVGLVSDQRRPQAGTRARQADGGR